MQSFLVTWILTSQPNKLEGYNAHQFPTIFSIFYLFAKYAWKLCIVVLFSTTIDTIETKSVMANKQFGTGNCTKLLLERYYCLA